MDIVKMFKAGLQSAPAEVNFENMKTHEMLDFYNRHASAPIKRFSSRSAAVQRCKVLWAALQRENSSKAIKQRASNEGRPAMRDSLKLDRRVVMVDTGEIWPNAYRMWCAYPALMTSAQQDRLTRQLYTSAKQGVREYVIINEMTYCLLHVDGLKDWSAK